PSRRGAHTAHARPLPRGGRASPPRPPARLRPPFPGAPSHRGLRPARGGLRSACPLLPSAPCPVPARPPRPPHVLPARLALPPRLATPPSSHTAQPARRQGEACHTAARSYRAPPLGRSAPAPRTRPAPSPSASPPPPPAWSSTGRPPTPSSSSAKKSATPGAA